MTIDTAAPEVKLTAHDLRVAIRERYALPEWHVEDEVALGGRRLDVVALNLWGARQWRVVGFELKVSRGDWLRELGAFQKSEDWIAVCDAFYIVTPPKLVRSDELPEGWGHLELCGSRMMTRRTAAQKTPSATLPREVAARFLARTARAEENAERSARWKAEADLRREIEESVRETHERERAQDREELAKMRGDHSRLLEALGISSSDFYGMERAMRAAGFLERFDRDAAALTHQLERSTEHFLRQADRIRDVLTTLRAPAT